MSEPPLSNLRDFDKKSLPWKPRFKKKTGILFQYFPFLTPRTYEILTFVKEDLKALS